MSSNTTFLLIISFAIGMIISWLIAKSKWAVRLAIMKADLDSAKKQLAGQNTFIERSENSMKTTFESLAASALNQNNQAFVTLAESRLGEKVTEAKGALEPKEQAIAGLVMPLAESLGKMDVKINQLEAKREGAYSNMNAVLEGMQRTAQSLDKGTQGLISALKSSSGQDKRSNRTNNIRVKRKKHPLKCYLRIS